MKASNILYNKLYEVYEMGKDMVRNFIKVREIESLNVMPYISESYIPNFIFYDLDKDGNGVAYSIDSIKVVDNEPIFYMSDNDGYYADKFYIDCFSANEVVYVLDTLEHLFEAIDKKNLPLLKENETFEDYE